MSNRGRGIAVHDQPAPLRAARFTRESTQGQSDMYGPEAQRRMQDRGIARLNAVDTGIHFNIAHSGLSVHQTPEWAEMLSRAGTDYDVLIVGYTSRLARRVGSQIAALEALHDAGAFVYFCDKGGVASNNRDQWQAWIQQAVEAESYSRNLSQLIEESLEAKWLSGIPNGRPPMGYTKDFAIDPIAAERVRTLFTEYATGNVSQIELAERHGIKAETVREILKNKTYMGLAGRKGEWIKGAFEPIISEELFDQCARVRSDHARAGGPPAKRPNMLQGRLQCICGTPARMDGADGAGQSRVMHPEPCEAWGRTERRQTRYYTEPLIAALSQMEWTPEEIDRIVASVPADQAPPPTPINWARERKQLADDFAAGRITAAQFMGLSEELAENERLERDDQRRHARAASTADETRTALSDFSAFVSRAKGDRQQLLWTILAQHYFDRFEHLGENRIRPVPNARGAQAFIASTMPEQVVLACPRGAKRSDATRTVQFIFYGSDRPNALNVAVAS